MYDSEIGLEENDAIEIKFHGGRVYLWMESDEVFSVSIKTHMDLDDVQIHFDPESGEIIKMASPKDRIDLNAKIQDWDTFLEKEKSNA